MHALRILSTHPIYRRYWVAMLISNLGNMMQGAAQSWLALQLSGSAEALGSVVALQFLPSLLLSIPAGALADSLPRRGIVQVTQFLMMVLTVLMAVLVWSGHIAFWHLLLLAFAQGCLVAVDLPARQALVVELVSKERYHEAMPLNSFAFNFSRLAGPALAGLCISTLGMAWSFWINALTFVPFLFTLPLLPNRPGGKAKGTALLGGLLGGFHYILETPLVRQLLLLLGWVSLFGVNFMTLIPAYAKLVLHLEVQGYGLLMSSLGLGALAGSSWQILSAKARPGRILKSIFALALLHIALAIELPVWAVGAIWAGCGFCMATVLINTNTSLQTLIPDELRGRITAIYTMLLLGATPIGSWLTGMLFDRCGGRITAGLLGLFTGLGLVLALRVELPKELQAVNSEEGARI